MISPRMVSAFCKCWMRPRRALSPVRLVYSCSSERCCSAMSASCWLLSARSSETVTASRAVSTSPNCWLSSGIRACISASSRYRVLSSSKRSSLGVSLNCSVKLSSFSSPRSLPAVASRSWPDNSSRRCRPFCSMKQEVRRVSPSMRPSSAMMRSLAVARCVMGSSAGIPNLRTSTLTCCSALPAPRSMLRVIKSVVAPIESVRLTLACGAP